MVSRRASMDCIALQSFNPAGRSSLVPKTAREGERKMFKNIYKFRWASTLYMTLHTLIRLRNNKIIEKK